MGWQQRYSVKISIALLRLRTSFELELHGFVDFFWRVPACVVIDIYERLTVLINFTLTCLSVGTSNLVLVVSLGKMLFASTWLFLSSVRGCWLTFQFPLWYSYTHTKAVHINLGHKM